MADTALDNVVTAYKATQVAYDIWQRSLIEKTEADGAEAAAKASYLEAKAAYKKALQDHGPGDAGTT